MCLVVTGVGSLENEIFEKSITQRNGPDGRDASSQPGRYSWDGCTLLPTGLGNQINQLADVSAVTRASHRVIGVLVPLHFSLMDTQRLEQHV